MRSDPLARYRALHGHCERMLDAARSEDWASLRRLGRESAAMVAKLHRAGCAIDDATRREKFRLLRSIVEIDAQIRHLSEPWTRTIDALLDPRRTVQRRGGAVARRAS
ncbi:MAG: flagellar protein FliT [Burkholderiaceae bacterium]|nr:flagellar protein FliT [Burkholderiaceae bacterium]